MYDQAEFCPCDVRCFRGGASQSSEAKRMVAYFSLSNPASDISAGWVPSNDLPGEVGRQEGEIDDPRHVALIGPIGLWPDRAWWGGDAPAGRATSDAPAPGR